MGEAVEKVPGGKLVRVRVEYDYKIDKVRITGDFFMHPEEGVTDIENCLIGFEKDAGQGRIAEEIRKTVHAKGITLIGVTEDAIAKLVGEAIK